VRRVTLPPPGDDAALHAAVDALFASPCDPRRPLWETYLVDGLAGGRTAVLSKVHHCMIDGVSGSETLELMTDPTGASAAGAGSSGRRSRWTRSSGSAARPAAR